MAWKQLARAPVRAIAGPVVRRIEARLRRHVDQRLDELSGTLHVMRAEIDGLNKAIPTVLAATSEGADTRALRRSLDELGRRRMVEMMWEIIYVDGRVTEFEENALWRASDLLGVSSRERIELRQRVAAGQGADPQEP